MAGVELRVTRGDVRFDGLRFNFEDKGFGSVPAEVVRHYPDDQKRDFLNAVLSTALDNSNYPADAGLKQEIADLAENVAKVIRLPEAAWNDVLMSACSESLVNVARLQDVDLSGEREEKDPFFYSFEDNLESMSLGESPEIEALTRGFVDYYFSYAEKLLDWCRSLPCDQKDLWTKVEPYHNAALEGCLHRAIDVASELIDMMGSEEAGWSWEPEEKDYFNAVLCDAKELLSIVEHCSPNKLQRFKEMIKAIESDLLETLDSKQAVIEAIREKVREFGKIGEVKLRLV